MGSATREALAAAREVLDGQNVDASTGEQLLQAGRVLGGSAQLRSALADPSAGAAEKRALVAAVFAGFGATARAVLDSVASTRWSTPEELLGGVEELGLRAIAASADDGLERELFTVASAVASDPTLELAIGSKLSGVDQKVGLVDRLLTGKAQPQTIAIVRHLVQQPRGRSLRESLRYASTVVADQGGRLVATVTSATPVAPAQLDRLEQSLTARYGRHVRLNQVIDPRVLGGLRVQVGNDVIDGSIAAKLNDLRLQLAG
ncbi:F-type H+-transporting ATPase subunit delta [Diaminobutyricimonas aerilata]|uniref:ATP synthase subunit delta n=1 Tax=Diaminobutyricimonas aerilata TaxID=1162967 RepID=A0A2M9CLF6_9MICO|nr:F0F1 ATP synthase subunit delta [Diaminobutyricimonas aerilata]PJJ72728.1 F-type H+-transporting ATPase subunit delta [Diaminobutyricimonas aerilata]